MSKKKRSKIKDYLVYLLARTAICIIQMLSYRAAHRFGKWLGWFLYHVDKRHRLVALDNLQHAYGSDLTDSEREQMAREVYLHLGRLMIDILHLPRRISVWNWREYGEMVDGRLLLRELLSDRPILLITGHFGNWEVSGVLLSLTFPMCSIARSIDNPYLDRYVRQVREKAKQRILAKHGELEQIQDVLEEGGVLGTLADQDAGSRGQFVPFFGRPASTHKGVALLALQHRVRILVVGTPLITEREVHGQHISGSRYCTLVEEVIDAEDYADRPDAIKALTERYTAALERLIRVAPEQYFWVHRRWKHQPRQRKKKKAS